MNELPISDINAEPPPENPQLTAPPKKASEVVVNFSDSGSLDFSNHLELSRAARMAAQLSLVPDRLKKEGVEACMAALVTCKQLNLPMMAMNEMGWIEGNLTVYGSLYWALAERHPEFGEHEMGWIDENCDKISVANKNLKNPVWGAVIRCRKKNSTVWNEYTFTKEEAETAKLWPPKKWDKESRTKVANPDSPWSKYFKDMLMHKAKKRCIDTNYASAVKGVIYHEDAYEYLKDKSAKDVTPKTTASDLESALGGKDEESRN